MVEIGQNLFSLNECFIRLIEVIASNLSILMYPKLLGIIGTTNIFIEEEKCDAAEKVLIELDTVWQRTRNVFGI